MGNIFGWVRSSYHLLIFFVNFDVIYVEFHYFFKNLFVGEPAVGELGIGELACR